MKRSFPTIDALRHISLDLDLWTTPLVSQKPRQVNGGGT
jgi:hypothetical protein